LVLKYYTPPLNFISTFNKYLPYTAVLRSRPLLSRDIFSPEMGGSGFGQVVKTRPSQPGTHACRTPKKPKQSQPSGKSVARVRSRSLSVEPNPSSLKISHFLPHTRNARIVEEESRRKVQGMAGTHTARQ